MGLGSVEAEAAVEAVAAVDVDVDVAAAATTDVDAAVIGVAECAKVEGFPSASAGSSSAGDGASFA